jgi:hypothetical protein
LGDPFGIVYEPHASPLLMRDGSQLAISYPMDEMGYGVTFVEMVIRLHLRKQA